MHKFKIGDKVYIKHPTTRKSIIGVVMLPLDHQTADYIRVKYGEYSTGYGAVPQFHVFKATDVMPRRGDIQDKQT